MSYRIEYDSKVGKYEVRKNERGYPVPLIMGLLGILAWVICGHREELWSFLIPGEDSVTVLAVRNMINELRCGAGLYEAVYDFCCLVIHGV